MRMILAAAAMAAAVGAAGAASATTFAGNYVATGYWTSENNGLQIQLFDGSDSFSVGNVNVGGAAVPFDLFYITAGEDVDVPGNDATPHSITVNFTFTNPNPAGAGPDGTVVGTTVGMEGIMGDNHSGDFGQLTWGPPATVDFAGVGRLTIKLNPMTFDTYDDDHSVSWNIQNGNKGLVTGTFQLTAIPGGVPEPATWGLMITGFGMAGATLRRRRTAAAAA